MYAEHTIAAIATPPGAGGIGIVRLSGPLCVAIAAAVVQTHLPAPQWVSHHLYRGRIVDAAGAVLDEALAVLMRAPHSYTGEDVLELHCHGSPVVLRHVLARVLGCGAVAAAPGEFTKRAFLNGRLDLAQAEAVIDLIRARTAGAAQVAAAHLGGALSAHLEALRDATIRLKALLEAQIDFSEEDVTIAPAELLALVADCTGRVETLRQSYAHGKLVRDGIRVAIVGKPNAGKSSLLNALLGEERAIVTPIAGTTRDVIEEAAEVDGIALVLADTAGLRPVEHADPVERLGMQRTTGAIAAAQVVLAVLDASRPPDAEDRAVLDSVAGLPKVVVLNKIDLGAAVFDAAALAGGAPVVQVSATERRGLADLRRALVDAVAGGTVPEQEGPVLTNARHYAALTQACASLELARDAIGAGRPPDLVAVDVQDAIDHIGAITGVVSSEDVLDRIFAEFCIGK